MRIGQLNKYITIEAPTRVPDGMGGYTETWTTIASDVPAAIWPVSATEVVRTGATAMIATDRIVIRYRSVLKASWRINWAGKYFNIVSAIDPNRARRWLHILVKVAS